MTRHALRIDIPAALWLSANARLHWGEAARRTRALRHSASIIARGAGLAGLGLARASVTVEVHRPRAGRADAANAAPAVKAVIDGLTDAGLWADDDDKHITAVTYVAGAPTRRRGWYALTITIEEEK
ncbi:hypothetical protein NSA19_02705 [Actinomyces bowdenii]|uniref:hypothetical protein n=1 Tax=Actinomyces bowdenii TaxID=131109 RepID=UPI00214B4F41|nr:hypothetical protein [Actinomyces bowdenii]MCR2051779.1 hypothetical protein [Actinomyces bowdenii]